VEFCERIKESGQTVPLVFRISFVCPKCPNEEASDNRAESVSLPSSLNLDPEWIAEIDRSLELVRRIEERMFLKCLSHSTVSERLFPCLNRLRKALLRQKSHLIAISPEQTPAVELEQGYTCTCEDQENKSELKLELPNTANF
jgi:hypothetical protein